MLGESEVTCGFSAVWGVGTPNCHVVQGSAILLLSPGPLVPGTVTANVVLSPFLS